MAEGMDLVTLEQEVVQRATSDPQFRHDLIRDPRGTMDREYGVKVPDRIQMTVLEESATAVYLVLPPALSNAGGELTDTELEAVAGGGYTEATACGTCVATYRLCC